jgi:hypothetical protein
MQSGRDFVAAAGFFNQKAGAHVRNREGSCWYLKQMLHGRKQEEAVWKLRGGRDTREPTTSPQLAALLQLAPSVSINIRLQRPC